MSRLFHILAAAVLALCLRPCLAAEAAQAPFMPAAPAMPAAPFVDAAPAIDAVPGVVLDSPIAPSAAPGAPAAVPSDPAGSANHQSAFPYYYNAGLPSSDDLVSFDDPPAVGSAPSMPPPGDSFGANQGALPGAYDSARLTQTRATLEAELARARAAIRLIQGYAEEGSDMTEAAGIYAGMPPFGDNTEINTLRADAAGSLILAFCRQGDLAGAQDVYRTLPYEVAGDDAALAKARAIINLTTHLVQKEDYPAAYAVLMDISRIASPARAALDAELFQLMTRIIPYLDNADETDKAHRVYTLLLEQVRTPEAAKLFAGNVPSLARYFLTYAERAVVPSRRNARLDFMNRIFSSLEPLAESPDIALLRVRLAEEMVDFFNASGDRSRAKYYYEIMTAADSTRLLEK